MRFIYLSIVAPLGVYAEEVQSVAPPAGLPSGLFDNATVDPDAAPSAPAPRSLEGESEEEPLVGEWGERGNYLLDKNGNFRGPKNTCLASYDHQDNAYLVFQNCDHVRQSSSGKNTEFMFLPDANSDNPKVGFFVYKNNLNKAIKYDGDADIAADIEAGNSIMHNFKAADLDNDDSFRFEKTPFGYKWLGNEAFCLGLTNGEDMLDHREGLTLKLCRESLEVGSIDGDSASLTDDRHFIRNSDGNCLLKKGKKQGTRGYKLVWSSRCQAENFEDRLDKKPGYEARYQWAEDKTGVHRVVKSQADENLCLRLVDNAVARNGKVQKPGKAVKSLSLYADDCNKPGTDIWFDSDNNLRSYYNGNWYCINKGRRARKCSAPSGADSEYDANRRPQFVNSQGFVSVTTGRDESLVRCAVDDGITKCHGIRYAAAPVGHLRFKHAFEHPGWDGVHDGRKASDFPACSQLTRSEGELLAPDDVNGGTQSEDCLTLNVFSPSGDNFDADFNDETVSIDERINKYKDEKRPVVVFFHGGAMIAGWANDPNYDASKYAREEGVVVVTVQYRLGAFGFLYDPEAGFKGNQALSDSLMALKWVRKNIHRFRGDPSNVTIMGQSAGAQVVAGIVAAKKNQVRNKAGAFDTGKSKLWIGNLYKNIVVLSLPAGMIYKAPHTQDYLRMQFSANLGCHFKNVEMTETLSADERKACYASRPREAIVAAQHAEGVQAVRMDPPSLEGRPVISSSFQTWLFTSDGKVFPSFDYSFNGGSDPIAILNEEVRHHKKNLINGNTFGEGTTYGFAFGAHIGWGSIPEVPLSMYYDQAIDGLANDADPVTRATFKTAYPYPCSGTATGGLADRWPAIFGSIGQSCEARFGLGELVGDYLFNCASRRAFKTRIDNKDDGAENAGNTYFYLFDMPLGYFRILPSVMIPACQVSTCHGADLDYLFGNFHGFLAPVTGEMINVSKQLRKQLANFAWSGDPNVSGKYQPADRNVPTGLKTWPTFSNDGTPGFNKNMVMHYHGSSPLTLDAMMLAGLQMRCDALDGLDKWSRY